MIYIAVVGVRTTLLFSLSGLDVRAEKCPLVAQFQNFFERQQGKKLTFFFRRHLAPKYSKVVAKSKKLVAIFFQKENKKY